ncbi:M23 family metallopeptidase, partial [Synechococcus sp. H70.2]
PAASLPPLPPARRSGFIWPVSGQVTSGFGYRRGRFHAGIDIAGPLGSPVVAVQEGLVTFAGNAGDGYGNYVDIRHPNGIVTRYAHGHQIYVSEGQYVQQGQVIMSRGNTGYSTGPHLHFEVRPGGGAPVNPLPYLP